MGFLTVNSGIDIKIHSMTIQAKILNLVRTTRFWNNLRRVRTKPNIVFTAKGKKPKSQCNVMKTESLNSECNNNNH